MSVPKEWTKEKTQWLFVAILSVLGVVAPLFLWYGTFANTAQVAVGVVVFLAWVIGVGMAICYIGDTLFN